MRSFIYKATALAKHKTPNERRHYIAVILGRRPGTSFVEAIRMAADQLQDLYPPTQATIYNWLAAHRKDIEAAAVPPAWMSKRNMLLRMADEFYLTPAAPTLKAAQAWITQQGSTEAPSLQELTDFVARLDAYWLVSRRHGQDCADVRYHAWIERGPDKIHVATYPGERLEAGAVDLGVRVCNEFGIEVDAKLTWYMDQYTRAVVAYDLYMGPSLPVLATTTHKRQPLITSSGLVFISHKYIHMFDCFLTTLVVPEDLPRSRWSTMLDAADLTWGVEVVTVDPLSPRLYAETEGLGERLTKWVRDHLGPSKVPVKPIVLQRCVTVAMMLYHCTRHPITGMSPQAAWRAGDHRMDWPDDDEFPDFFCWEVQERRKALGRP